MTSDFIFFTAILTALSLSSPASVPGETDPGGCHLSQIPAGITKGEAPDALFADMQARANRDFLEQILRGAP